MPTLTGVHLLPATGEFAYDTIAYLGQRTTEPSLSAINTYSGQSPTTDYSVSLNDLQAQHPECATVSIVCAWVCDGLAAGSNHVYPSTTYTVAGFAALIFARRLTAAPGGGIVWNLLCASRLRGPAEGRP